MASFSLLAVMMVFLSGCGEDYLSTLKPSGEVGKQQLNLLLLTTVIMTLVVVIVSVIYLLAFLKYRRARVGENVIPKQVEGSHTFRSDLDSYSDYFIINYRCTSCYNYL